MSLEFDHLVVIVESLADAVRCFESAGFRVTPGGRHDVLPTVKALVPFAGGGYLELLAAQDPATRASWRAQRGSERWEAQLHKASAISRRFLPRLAGDAGVGDYAMRTSRLARLAGEARRRGTVLTGPVPMERKRPDGERLAWRLLLPASDVLPILIEDETPRERRVPTGPGACAHPNGATAIAAIRVRARSVPESALALGELFDTSPSVDATGASCIDCPGLRVTLVPGEADGACGATLSGVNALPAELAALGLTVA